MTAAATASSLFVHSTSYVIISSVLSLLYFIRPNYVTKPLSIIALSGLISWNRSRTTGEVKGDVGSSTASSYDSYISIGLMLSSCGDAMLELDDNNKDYFIAGLVAFLLAHLSYICAFTSEAIQYTSMLAFIFIISGIYYAAMMSVLLPSVESDLVLPVIVYGLVISAMLLFGTARYTSTSHTYTHESRLSSLMGSIIFLLSDTILALDKFAFRITSAKTIIMLTYYIGQMFIAISTCKNYLEEVKKQHST